MDILTYEVYGSTRQAEVKLQQVCLYGLLSENIRRDLAEQA